MNPAQAGWSFLAGFNGLNALGGNNRCDVSKFHFYANNANQGRLALRLSGSGCARIVFSNCMFTIPPALVGI